MLITADLVDPSDQSMSQIGKSYSPGPAAAGVIGQPSPGLYNDFNHFTSRPKSWGNGSRDPDDIDLATLIAQAHRQRELEQSRVSQNGGSENGHGVIAEKNDEPSKRRVEDPWEKRPNHSIMNGNGNGNGIASMPSPMLNANSLPHSAPLPTFQPFPDNPPHHSHTPSNPLLHIQPSLTGPIVPPANAAEQVAHHLMSLSTIFNPLLMQGEEVERLRMEVEMWKGEWGRLDKELRRLESAVKTVQAQKVSFYIETWLTYSQSAQCLPLSSSTVTVLL